MSSGRCLIRVAKNLHGLAVGVLALTEEWGAMPGRARLRMFVCVGGWVGGYGEFCGFSQQFCGSGVVCRGTTWSKAGTCTVVEQVVSAWGCGSPVLVLS